MDSDRRSWDRLILNSRLALAIGFGSLLLIMALAGADALRVLRNFRASDDGIRRQFLLQNHLPRLPAQDIARNPRLPNVEHLPAKEAVCARPRQEPARSVEDLRRRPIPINLPVFFFQDRRVSRFGSILLHRRGIVASRCSGDSMGSDRAEHRRACVAVVPDGEAISYAISRFHEPPGGV